MYANANPLAFVDPTGHTAEGAELQGVLRETKDYLQSQAKGTGVTGFLKGVGFGILSGAVGIVESAVGMIDEGATVAYTVPGVDMTGDPTGQESRQEIKQQYEDLRQTYHVIKEEGFFNAASRIAGNAADTLVAAAKGDPQAIAKITSFATEMVGPTVALKGSGALGAMRRGAKELVEGAGRAVRHGWDEAAGALRRGGDDLAEAGRYRIGDLLPDGRIAGEGPGAALRGGPEFGVAGNAAARHAAWSRSIPDINRTVQGLGERALRGSGGDWQKAESTFRRYLGGVERRMQAAGGPYGVDWQPAAIPGKGRVPAFRTFWNRSQGRFRTYATRDSRRLDAGLTDLAAPGPLRPLVSGYDITLNASKPSIVQYYQDAFGQIPILDIRVPQ